MIEAIVATVVTVVIGIVWCAFAVRVMDFLLGAGPPVRRRRK